MMGDGVKEVGESWNGKKKQTVCMHTEQKRLFFVLLF